MKIKNLKREGDRIDAEFDSNLNFIEGSNSAGYPTTVMSMSWFQFAPAGLEDEIHSVMDEMIELWNEKHK